jgi:cysteine desulfurase/selenocysteine lyase
MASFLHLTPAPQNEECCPFDVQRIRREFPILSREVRGKPLVYLDNAATTQKPRVVIEALVDYYERHNANVHRGAHTLAEEATEMYEDARAECGRFVNVHQPKRVIFTRNTTESLNLMAYAWARPRVGPGDVILSTAMEHHSNIVPWQLIAKETGATLAFVPVTPGGTLDVEAYRRLLSPAVKIFTVVHGSNVVGTINPVAEMIRELRAAAPEATAIVDATQTVPQLPVSFDELGCDALAYSGHKTYGPTGIGVLIGSEALVEEMGPFLGGGEMIERVTLQGSTFAKPPHRFEAGTPNIADAVGLAAALRYLSKYGMDRIRHHGICLTEAVLAKLAAIPSVRVLGPTNAEERVALVAFADRDVHPHDLATILDRDGVAIRAGHHCAMPVMEFYGVAATARASFGLYNTEQDIDVLMDGIRQVIEVFG